MKEEVYVWLLVLVLVTVPFIINKLFPPHKKGEGKREKKKYSSADWDGR